MCMIDDADGYPEFSNETKRKARKKHRCGECGRFIEPGEFYFNNACLFDGSFSVDKMCSHCRAGASLLQEHCGGFLFGGVHDDLEEHIHELLPWSGKAARFVIGMRRKWKRFDGNGVMREPS